MKPGGRGIPAKINLRLWLRHSALLGAGRLCPKTETKIRPHAPKQKEQIVKNEIALKNAASHPGRFASALSAILLLVITASSSSGQVLPPSSLPYGYSYQEWSVKWWQWSLGLSTNHMDLVGAPDICSGPARDVRFLAGVYGFGTNVVTRKVTIAPGTPLFFSILSFNADNTSCPLSTFTTNTAAQLATEAVEGWASALVTTCTIDGVAVEGMEEPTNSIYNVVSPAFSYTTAEKDNDLSIIEGEDCIPGGLTIYPAVADGIYLMLSPLKPGHHTITFAGVVGPLSAPSVDDEATYDIAVE
jgi:hypothetical protein